MSFLGLSLLSWMTSETTSSSGSKPQEIAKSEDLSDFRSYFESENTGFTAAPPQGNYIPSTGKGADENVHHRLPNGQAVTFDDIRRAVAEGRGDGDVSPYFNGQTNYQALASLGLSKAIEAAPEVVSTLVALSQRSWISLASSLTDSFGLGDDIRTALRDDRSEPKAFAEQPSQRADADLGS